MDFLNEERKEWGGEGKGRRGRREGVLVLLVDLMGLLIN